MSLELDMLFAQKPGNRGRERGDGGGFAVHLERHGFSCAHEETEQQGHNGDHTRRNANGPQSHHALRSPTSRHGSSFPFSVATEPLHLAPQAWSSSRCL